MPRLTYLLPFYPQPLTKEQIDAIFLQAREQADYIIGLYRAAYPNSWDRIDHVEGWPRVSHETHKYLMNMAIAFDRVNHPNLYAGGNWMSKGFKADAEMPDWVVKPCEAVLKEL